MPETVLTHLERLAVASLSVPRNVEDLALELRANHHLKADPSGADVKALLDDVLEPAGLVVRLGEHDDLAKLAASLERKRGVVAMPDVKARNYVNRLAHPRRAHRGRGELYIYTQQAHDYLTGPTPGLEAVELTTAELEALIAREAGRVAHELGLEGTMFDEESAPGARDGGGRLRATKDAGDLDLEAVSIAGRLLPEEFAHWVKVITAEHEARTGERPRPIIAGGSYGDATELLILAAETGGTAYGETSPTYGALLTVLATDADTGSTLTRANYTGYQDKSIANADYNAPSAGAHTNLNAITWAGATGGTSTCVGFARVTTQGGGRLIRRAPIASVIVSATNTPASVAAGALIESLD